MVFAFFGYLFNPIYPSTNKLQLLFTGNKGNEGRLSNYSKVRFP